MGYVGKVTADGSTHLVGSTLYGTCSTAAATAAKVVTCADFDHLFTGVTIHVKFTNSNTASNATLNVNSTGAKNLCRYGTTRVGTTTKASWSAGAVVSFTYDGTSWVMNDYIEDTDSNTTYSLSKTGGQYVTDGYVITLTPSSGTATNAAIPVASDTVPGVVGIDFSVSQSNVVVPTSGAVYTAIQNAMGDVAGALVYKGTATSESAITDTSYKKGWYWIVAMPDSTTTSITIAGQTCEAGDMVIAKQAKTSTVANDLDIVQTNTERITNAEIDTIVAS